MPRYRREFRIALAPSLAAYAKVPLKEWEGEAECLLYSAYGKPLANPALLCNYEVQILPASYAALLGFRKDKIGERNAGRPFRYGIAFAQPTSDIAEVCGFARGCWFLYRATVLLQPQEPLLLNPNRAALEPALSHYFGQGFEADPYSQHERARS